MCDYKIVVCDDEELCRSELKLLLEEYEVDNNINFEVDFYENGTELLKKKVKNYNIFLLDIEMEDINGIEIAKQIIKEYPDAIIMFITGYDSYIDNAFDLKVMRYLNKPVDKKRLYRALDIAISDINRQKQYVNVRDYRGEHCKIKINDIIRIYIEGRKVALEASKEIYETNKTFSEFEKLVENFDFVHTYKKRLVNLMYVSGFEDDKLLLIKGKNEIQEYINPRLMSHVRTEWLLYGRRFR
ncbi:LytR/AlgR family response regulator transcription factor [Sedimentibacter sp. MB31-C6]|uniref:LytR/AlgR family response regulator transcription factor n=1 Tax=Sedimentibacter sp. MB31-C6 TaxID=3109366 RepID=UPI002DDCF8C3|nr:LytTR family DNA-binding domain-containing protein [Sedimentibacter sp. MB36-C1]WSI04150.1 LytTR family DNA-binding domain-containing protein [Sedimentibacter sp. MB36-C1]